MAGSCSFCDRQATTTVADDNDVFPCCSRCASDWDDNPGFISRLDQTLARSPMTSPSAPAEVVRLVADMQRLRQHHEFTRDRIGQPGCPVRRTAAEYVETIDRAIAILSPPAKVPPRWATDDDPVRALAIKLAARANDREEEGGEWTWHDIAVCAMQALNTRPVASTLDAETAFRAGFDVATKYDWEYRAEGHELELREAELKRWLEGPGKTGSAGVGEGTP